MCTGLAQGYREPEKKRSLLKPYTKYEMIQSLSLDEMASVMPCPYERDFTTDDFCRDKNCIKCTKEWLESEV